MFSPKNIEQLKKQLFLFVQDKDQLSFDSFGKNAVYHHYYPLFNAIEQREEKIVRSIQLSPTTIAIHQELQILTQWPEKDQLLKELFFHLKKTGQIPPPVWLPQLLNIAKEYPALWQPLYQIFPDLIPALAQTHPSWAYMISAFDHQGNSLEVKNDHFYPALWYRMKNFPSATTTYIIQLFENVSNQHKTKLLEIFSVDTHPEIVDFVYDKINQQPKAVRLAALKILIKQKNKKIYSSLIEYITPLIQSGYDPTEVPKPNLWKTIFKKEDIKSLTSQKDLPSTVLALISPGDLKLEPSKVPDKYQKFTLDAALFHGEMPYILQWIKINPKIEIPEEIKISVQARDRSLFIKGYYIEANKSLSADFFEDLKKISPFLTLEDSLLCWNYMKQQFGEFTYIDSAFSVNLLAIKIHPNAIKPVLEDLFFKRQADWHADFKKILTIRKRLLKKIYPL